MKMIPLHTGHICTATDGMGLRASLSVIGRLHDARVSQAQVRRPKDSNVSVILVSVAIHFHQNIGT